MKRILNAIAIITISLLLTSCSTQKVISNREEANTQNLISTVEPIGDKIPKTVNQGDTVELVEIHKSIDTEKKPIANEGEVFKNEGQISKVCESLNAVPAAWSPDRKRIAVTSTGRTWIDTHIVDVETGKASETGVFEYIAVNAKIKCTNFANIDCTTKNRHC